MYIWVYMTPNMGARVPSILVLWSPVSCVKSDERGNCINNQHVDSNGSQMASTCPLLLPSCLGRIGYKIARVQKFNAKQKQQTFNKYPDIGVYPDTVVFAKPSNSL